MVTNDPFESASNPEITPREYYGQANVNCEYCVLVKGQGRMPFDPATNKESEKRTAVDISITALPELNVTRTPERKMIAESREWAGIVWPNIKALGINNARDLGGKWVKANFVATGETFQGRHGDTVDKTTWKFSAIYPDEGACRAAYYADNANDAPAPLPNTPVTQGNPQERDNALKILTVLVKQAGGDFDKIAIAIAKFPVVSKYFTVGSPEIVSIMTGGAV